MFAMSKPGLMKPAKAPHRNKERRDNITKTP
ncbi:hypothetical protein H206_05286 [Candidatus Electrothrix aarhusensis]|uniref:Uncharacterized protein n=1 Tax=Candidatus Electrothrix aarhusensis TaxID=1859131 RepID=A0A3S3QLZ6_9BACT|nr:hypothetical protein H206_05286 [Candidatus Electrothrix aarhusensis]